MAKFPISGIDFDFRPETYWEDKKELDARKKGTYSGARIDFEAVQKNFFGLRPHLRSGEDLPSFSQTEVEIARLRLTKTIHEEVTSIRARRVGNRIAYRIVDETATPEGARFCVSPQTSRRPLTLGQLIHLIDNAELYWDDELAETGLVVRSWENQVAMGHTAVEELKTWIEVTSVFYPHLPTYYDWVFIEWAVAKGFLPAASARGLSILLT